MLKTANNRFLTLNAIFLAINFNKLSIKYRSCPKSTKIDAFELKICICHGPMALIDK